MASLLPDPDPKTMRKMESMHFLVEGAYIQNLARRAFWFEDNETWAMNLLKDSFGGITDDQVMQVLNGDAQIKGWGICDKKECRQCKGLEQTHLEEKADKKFKKEIAERVAWLTEACYKIGEFHIEKSTVDNYLENCVGMEKARLHSREEVFDHFVDTIIPTLETGFYSAAGYRKPSVKFVPKENTKHYKFNELIQNWFDDVKARISSAITKHDPPIMDLLDQIKAEIAEKPLVSMKITASGRVEGCILCTIPNPAEDYKEIKINMPKEALIEYLKARQRTLYNIKFTMTQDTDKDILAKRIENYDKLLGSDHERLMHSMGLYHAETGHYDADELEYMVDKVVDACIKHIAWNDELKEIKKLPDTIEFRNISENKALVDLYFDGVLIEKEHYLDRMFG